MLVASAEALITDRTRALVVVSPNNPTGVEYPPALIRDLLALAVTGRGYATDSSVSIHLAVESTTADGGGVGENLHERGTDAEDELAQAKPLAVRAGHRQRCGARVHGADIPGRALRGQRQRNGAGAGAEVGADDGAVRRQRLQCALDQ